MPLVARIVSTVISELPDSVPAHRLRVNNTTIKSVQRSVVSGRSGIHGKRARTFGRKKALRGLWLDAGPSGGKLHAEACPIIAVDYGNVGSCPQCGEPMDIKQVEPHPTMCVLDVVRTCSHAAAAPAQCSEPPGLLAHRDARGGDKPRRVRPGANTAVLTGPVWPARTEMPRWRGGPGRPSPLRRSSRSA
jgi:hypothetical protein